MTIRKRTVGLIAFLKGSSDIKDQMVGCANYDHHKGGCLYSETCLVEQKKRCSYFEKAVLPTAADMGMKDLVLSLYEKQIGIAGIGQLRKIDSLKERKCPDCGRGLKPRQRYCDNCTKKRRKATYYNSKRNSKTQAQHLTENDPCIVEPNRQTAAL